MYMKICRKLWSYIDIRCYYHYYMQWSEKNASRIYCKQFLAEDEQNTLLLIPRCLVLETLSKVSNLKKNNFEKTHSPESLSLKSMYIFILSHLYYIYICIFYIYLYNIFILHIFLKCFIHIDKESKIEY